MMVRTVPRAKMVRYISKASSMPRTNSTASETAVMISVTTSACHQ